MAPAPPGRYIPGMKERDVLDMAHYTLEEAGDTGCQDYIDRITGDYEEHQPDDYEQEKRSLQDARALVPAPEIDIWDMYRVDGACQSGVAELFGVSQGTVSNIVRRVEERIKYFSHMPPMPDGLRTIVEKAYSTTGVHNHCKTATMLEQWCLTGHQGKAAKAANVSQPYASMHIKSAPAILRASGIHGSEECAARIEYMRTHIGYHLRQGRSKL